MELFGIGPMELIFIFIIILLVIGPRDLDKTSRSLGRMINRVYKSPNYQVVRRASEELRNLPARLAREAQLDELKEMADLSDVKKELQETANTIGKLENPFEAWTKDLKPGEQASPPSNGSQSAPAATPSPTPPPADPQTATPPPSDGNE